MGSAAFVIQKHPQTPGRSSRTKCLQHPWPTVFQPCLIENVARDAKRTNVTLSMGPNDGEWLVNLFLCSGLEGEILEKNPENHNW